MKKWYKFLGIFWYPLVWLYNFTKSPPFEVGNKVKLKSKEDRKYIYLVIEIDSGACILRNINTPEDARRDFAAPFNMLEKVS